MANLFVSGYTQYIMEMTRTLLTVPKRTLSQLKAIAQRRQTTVSFLLREAIEKTYEIDAGIIRNPKWRNDPLVKSFGTLDRLILSRKLSNIRALGCDLGGSAAAEHDRLLYGDGK